MTGRPLEPGSSAGHYDVISRLGRGGMGEVFLARDTRLDRQVALKVLVAPPGADAAHFERFDREAKSLATLSHPNIVTVFAVEEIAGHRVLAMEYVDGDTLRDAIPPGGLPLGRACRLAFDMADALDAAHGRGVTHRDLKPENVMVTRSGRVKVLDFGLAKVRAAAGWGDAASQVTGSLTMAGVVLGTLPYMSPEQVEGREVDHRSDLFSLGVILYEMLAGRRPFEGESNARLVAAILRDPPAPLRDLRPDTPPALAALVDACLEKDPARRLGSAAELRDRIDEAWRLLDATSDPYPARRPDSGARPASGAAPRGGRLLGTKAGLSLVLAGLFAVNWIETTSEAALQREFGWGVELGYHVARAVHWFERYFSFERHDLTNPLAVYGYSAAYFFLPAVVAVATIAALARRPGVGDYRVFVLAIVVAYAASLPFYVFLPLPERWAYSGSEAILLSDRWTAALIQAIRPISGIDNCFPSFHVSSATATSLVWYRAGLAHRHAVASAAAAIVLSTWVLGIHWMADIVAGLALGVIAVAVAARLDRRLAGG